jgi:hypothetical protein
LDPLTAAERSGLPPRYFSPALAGAARITRIKKTRRGILLIRGNPVIFIVDSMLCPLP